MKMTNFPIKGKSDNPQAIPCASATALTFSPFPFSLYYMADDMRGKFDIKRFEQVYSVTL